jgi:toxin HigB-1
MIKSFKNRKTEVLFNSSKFKNFDKKTIDKAVKKLDYISHAAKIEDFYFPPSNHFEKLEGHNPTRYSIMINKQWRISFEWQETDAYNVLVEDYH